MREDEARAALQDELARMAGEDTSYTNVTQRAGGGQDDELRIELEAGTFVVTAPRLWIDWRPS